MGGFGGEIIIVCGVVSDFLFQIRNTVFDYFQKAYFKFLEITLHLPGKYNFSQQCFSIVWEEMCIRDRISSSYERG